MQRREAVYALGRGLTPAQPGCYNGGKCEKTADGRESNNSREQPPLSSPLRMGSEAASRARSERRGRQSSMIKTPLGTFLKDGTFVPAHAPGTWPFRGAPLKEQLKFKLSSAATPPSSQASIPPPAPSQAGATKHGAGGLFYGGTPAKTPYQIGCKPAKSTTFRKQKRHELIARMENAALPEGQIAVLLGISVPRLRSIKQHPDYLAARMKVTLGLIVDTDASLDQIREQRKEMLTQLLPPALQVIANAVQTPALSFAERRLQISVAQDILDREGTFAKISRSEVKPVEHFDWESTDASAARALDVVKGTMRLTEEAPQVGDTETKKKIEKIIEITRHFSAGKTPSGFNQQEALKELEKA